MARHGNRHPLTAPSTPSPAPSLLPHIPPAPPRPVRLYGRGVIFTADGTTYSSANGSLALSSTVNRTGMERPLGRWTESIYTWKAAGSITLFQTSLRLYDQIITSSGSRAGMVVFRQQWPDGASRAGSGNQNAVSSSFPIFDTGRHSDVVEQGYWQWMSNWEGTSEPRVWNADGLHMPALLSGPTAGPIIVFDRGNSSVRQVASVISPSSGFMDASMVQQRDGSLHFGMMDSYASIPSSHSLDHVVYIEANGVVQATEHWGDVLLDRYHKEREPMYAPLETRYVGYSSDNGAFYYYNPLNNGSYEDTFLAVQRYFRQAQIPYRHLELDSFWYYKAAGGGVLNWTAMPSAFPSGLVEFARRIQMPFTAHNRWWAPNPSYAKQFGGQYDWIVEPSHSVPVDPRFWPDLFNNASQWGLRVYEQDWLSPEYSDTTALHSQVGLARQWLMQMGSGAWDRHRIIIQYCGPLIRHILQSVEIEAVRQSRASGDYEPGNRQWDNWDIRYTSLLMWSLGVAPYKDTYWTTSAQPGNKYAVGYEPEPDMQSLIAILSAGPVLPGDAIGRTNVSLLNMSYRADGLLLKPDRPAFPTDADFVGMAFDPAYNRTVGRSSTTYTAYRSPVGDFATVMNLRTLRDCNRTGYAAPPARTARGWYLGAGLRPVGTAAVVSFHYSEALHWAAEAAGVAPLVRRLVVGLDEPVPHVGQDVPACGYIYTRVSPCIGTLCVLGEADKWVAISKQRIARLAQNAEGAALALEGSPGEVVRIGFMVTGGTEAVAECALGREGRAVLDWRVASLPKYTCTAAADDVVYGEAR